MEETPMLLKQGKKDLLEYRVYASRDAMGQAAGNDIADAIVALLKEKELKSNVQKMKLQLSMTVGKSYQLFMLFY